MSGLQRCSSSFFTCYNDKRQVPEERIADPHLALAAGRSIADILVVEREISMSASILYIEDDRDIGGWVSDF